MVNLHEKRIFKSKRSNRTVVLKLGKVTDTLLNYPILHIVIFDKVSVTSRNKRKVEHYQKDVSGDLKVKQEF